MEDKWKTRFAGLQTIALWLLLLIVAGWIFFKPDNNLNKDTIDKLTGAVERISDASMNMAKIATEQREWADNLQKTATKNQVQRNSDYNDLYGKYGYDEKSNISLDDIYARRVQQSAEDLRRSDVRRDENGAGKTGPIPPAASEHKK